MVERASQRNPDVEYVAYDGVTFPFDTGSFDVVFASCVFHHVVPHERARLAGEMARVTRDGGIVTILEHNPFNPATRLVVSRCEFDKDAILLARRESERLLSDAGLAPAETRLHPLLPVPERLERRLGALAARRAVLRRELAVDRVVPARASRPT